jgi:hypothetical protein
MVSLMMNDDDEKQYLFRDVQLSNSWFKWYTITNINNDKNIYKITKFDMLYYSTISNLKSQYSKVHYVAAKYLV